MKSHTMEARGSGAAWQRLRARLADMAATALMVGLAATVFCLAAATAHLMLSGWMASESGHRSHASGR